ncbi:MAG TPA: sialate O-acetylesterase [Flavisolibacter sp.]|nr:sialate O-acetylesterase [Flavisolibacter sp.]
MKELYSLLIALILFAGAKANVTMPRIFSDNMVLQRNKEIPVWGWAKPNETVVVSFNKQSKTARADKNGNWAVKLSPETAGGPYSLTIKGNNTTTFSNVLVGEVWICSGQSNMEWALRSAVNAENEIAAADFPEIRSLTVPKVISLTPEKDIKADAWQICTPENARSFSAVGYFFARKLYQELKVPIGFINTSWGGTQVESWISRKALEQSEEFKNLMSSMPVLNMDSLNREKDIQLKKDLLTWKKEIIEPEQLNSWNKPDLDDSKWNKIQEPAMWESQGMYAVDGKLLFRKSFVVNKDEAGKAAILELGKIDDNDVTYVNGVKVGATEGYTVLRKYTIPQGILKEGNNVIAVQVEDNGGGGGFYGESGMKVTFKNREESLAGLWAFKIESLTAASLGSVLNPNAYPTLLFNAMVNPLIPFAMQGVIWYQGESNTGRAVQYQKAFPLMIQDWRRHWGQGDFPFYFVQLASFDAGGSTEKKQGYQWAELREAQTLTLSQPNTGMAVTTDIGDPKDIHPRNKQDVGLRLALVALNKTYGKPIVSSGPMFQSMKAEGNKLILSFSETGGGLVTNDKYGYIRGFEVAGADRKYVYAKAFIKGNQVVVYADDVKDPVAVRFGWFDDASENNLFNKEGLPANPFSTDTWERVTNSVKYQIR